MSDSRPIGVFDSGLGGLTVVRKLIKYMPKEDIVYFGDTGRVPYGTRSLDTIRRYAGEDENFLISKDVKLIIAACGTVSSVAADISSRLTVPFFEVVSHASAAAVQTTENGRIGVIGTAATIKSGKHREIIKSIMPQAQVVSNSCSLFVPLVEEGWYDENDIVVCETVRRYLKPIMDFGADTLILGCTHYPVLSPVIKKVTGDKMALIDAGEVTSRAVSEFLRKENMLNEKGAGNCRFYVSDKADSFRRQASVLLGAEIDESKVEQVSLSSL